MIIEELKIIEISVDTHGDVPYNVRFTGKNMPNYISGAFGQKVYVSFNIIVDTATGFTMTLEPQFSGGERQENQEDKKLVVTPVLGTVDVVVDDGKLIANEYVEYVTVKGDLTVVGRWRVKAEATLPSQVVVSNFKFIRVLE